VLALPSVHFFVNPFYAPAMRNLLSVLSGLASLAYIVSSSPVPDNGLEKRAISSHHVCSEVNLVVDVLKLYKATPFCSSFLHIPTSTVQHTSTATSDVYATNTNTMQATITTTVQTE
jgi:hypothetical protein